MSDLACSDSICFGLNRNEKICFYRKARSARIPRLDIGPAAHQRQLSAALEPFKSLFLRLCKDIVHRLPWAMLNSTQVNRGALTEQSL